MPITRQAARHAATLLCAGTLLGCSAEPTSNAPGAEGELVGGAHLGVSGGPSGPRATGHGNVINVFQDVVRRSFNAIHQDQRDGDVVGHFVQHNASGFFAWGEINCLHLLTPNEAVLSGPVRDSSIPALIDRTGIFRVADGGEGHDAVDRMSNLFVAALGSAQDCRSDIEFNHFVLTGGNIQVEP